MRITRDDGSGSGVPINPDSDFQVLNNSDSGAPGPSDEILNVTAGDINIDVPQQRDTQTGSRMK